MKLIAAAPPHRRASTSGSAGALSSCLLHPRSVVVLSIASRGVQLVFAHTPTGLPPGDVHGERHATVLARGPTSSTACGRASRLTDGAAPLRLLVPFTSSATERAPLGGISVAGPDVFQTARPRPRMRSPRSGPAALPRGRAPERCHRSRMRLGGGKAG